MSTPAFPITTLGQPLSDGFKLKLDDIKVRSDTQCGLAASLNASNGFLTAIELNWTWSSEQYDVFCDWYRDDIKDGSIEFTISSLYLFSSPGEVTCRFTEPYKAKYEPWGHWNVSVKLETRDAAFISEATLDAALPADPHTDCVTLPVSLFGNIGSDTSEEPQQSFNRGKTSGYARPQQSRRSPVTVTRVPVALEMDDDAKALFMAWWHYKLTNGAAWFWLWMEFHGVYQYRKVRFTESLSLTYQDVGWWKISGTIETVEYNYLPLDDCRDLIAPNEAPQIITQPSDVVGRAGDTIEFYVVAGGELPRRIQWYYGSAIINGATSANYSFAITTTNFGEYHCVITNDYGMITSSNASALLIPAITEQPDWSTVQTGGTTSATVTAVGSGTFEYQWYKDYVLLAGETSDTITITDAEQSDAGDYYCVVTSEYGSTESSIARLYVNFYFSVSEYSQIAVTPYMVDSLSATLFPDVNEYSTIAVSPYLLDDESGTTNTPDTESATITITPYFLDEEGT